MSENAMTDFDSPVPDSLFALDVVGNAIKTAFGVDKFRWENDQTEMSSLVQKKF